MSRLDATLPILFLLTSVSGLVSGCDAPDQLRSAPALAPSPLASPPVGSHTLIETGVTLAYPERFEVAGLGDTNGDGYDDVAVTLDSQSKAVLVYLGGADGIATEPALVLTSPDYLLGESSSLDGADVDGDGYADLVRSAHYFHDVVASTYGVVYVHRGGPGGLDPTPVSVTPCPLETDFFGRTVVGLGDVNGDGYEDVGIESRGNSLEATPAFVYVYHGGPSGLPATPTTAIPGPPAFERAVAGAGDLDADGYDDLVVGDWRDDTAGTNAGLVAVYRGGPAGIEAEPSWTFLGAQAGAQLGRAVAGGGDSNGDGIDDLVFTAPGAQFGAPSPRVYLVYGGVGGPGPEPDWSASTLGVSDRIFGLSADFVGDIDGDGLDDFAVGRPSDGPSFGFGDVAIWLGSTTGPASVADYFEGDPSDNGPHRYGFDLAGAGDVDGDGWSDLVVGSPGKPGGTINALPCDALVLYGTCSNDPDGDEVCGSDDGCPNDAAKTEPGLCGCGAVDDPSDEDRDGVIDCLDACPADPGNDADSDGVCLADDNCPDVFNPTQADGDDDGVGDACDPDGSSGGDEGSGTDGGETGTDGGKAGADGEAGTDDEAASEESSGGDEGAGVDEGSGCSCRAAGSEPDPRGLWLGLWVGALALFGRRAGRDRRG